MSITIEEGKFYRRADGSVHGPALRYCLSNQHTHPWRLGTYVYTDTGEIFGDSPRPRLDLIAEAADPSAPAEDDGFITRGTPDWTAQVEAEAAEEFPFAPTHPEADPTYSWTEQVIPKTQERMTKAKLLDGAKAAVADRGLNYGTPEDNFRRICALWNKHLENRGVLIPGTGMRCLDTADVAMMMVLLKVARLENQPNHMDSWTDIAGYAACGAELTDDRT